MPPLITAAAALLGVALTVLGGFLVSASSRRHDREQLGRSVLMTPAEQFARSALAALAALRYVTPPSLPEPGKRPHRNEGLLADLDGQKKLLTGCRTALDLVRVNRAHVRLAFNPKSWPAEHSRNVLAHLREALSKAEDFYWEANAQGEDTRQPWRSREGLVLRDEYHRERDLAYAALDDFFDRVGERLEKPTWKLVEISGPGQWRYTDLHSKSAVDSQATKPSQVPGP